MNPIKGSKFNKSQYIFVYFGYTFILDVQPQSVPLQVVVDLRPGQNFEAKGEIKFSPV
jgi:hypothetical protein